MPLQLVSLLLLTSLGSAGPTTPVLRFDGPGLAEAARGVPLRGPLTLAGVPLADGPVDLALERFAAFAPDAVIEIHGENGVTRQAPPDNAYFKGTIAGRPGSLALLTARESGGLHGLLVDAGQAWSVGEDPVGRLAVKAVDLGQPRRTPAPTCETDQLEADALPALLARQQALAAAPAAPAVRASHTARVAVETDYELFQLFGDASAELNYIGDLFAYSSSIYDREIDTTELVAYVRLWTTAADPWTQTSSRCAFYEFGRYWNQNMSGVSRTIAHMVSGKASGGGIAWVGVLCSGSFSVNHGGACPALTPQTDVYGGAYGFSGSIEGSFNLGSPAQVWDIIVVSHEIGHNFNSPHTHCYANLGGNASQVDQCWTGETSSFYTCYSGATSLPGGGSVTGGTPGGSNGTLMSYCHQISPGYTNVALNFGTGHPYGVAPDRVPQRMAAHVASAAASNPACLAFTPPTKGDFNLDRGPDLVLRNTSTNQYNFWFMSGVTRAYEGGLSPNPTASQRVVGTDDFNGDQRTDLVVQDQVSGALEFWMMKSAGARWGSAVPLSGAAPLTAPWQMAATGDFNADGWPDLVWRNASTQKISIWTMNGTARLGTITPTPDQAVDGNWAIVATLDYNKDGATDFLWYNSTSGKIVLWFMNAAVQRVTGQFTNPANAGDNNWKVVASSDYGVGPGGVADSADIVWRNDTSGKLVVWYMNTSGTRTSGTFTSPDAPANPLSWTVDGPR